MPLANCRSFRFDLPPPLALVPRRLASSPLLRCNRLTTRPPIPASYRGRPDAPLFPPDSTPTRITWQVVAERTSAVRQEATRTSIATSINRLRYCRAVGPAL